MLPNLRQVGGCADRGIHGELVQCCTPRTSPVEKLTVCGRGRTQRRNTADELAVTFERPVDLDLDAAVWKSVPWGRWRAQSAGMSWNLWRHRGERFLLLRNCRLSRSGDSSESEICKVKPQAHVAVTFSWYLKLTEYALKGHYPLQNSWPINRNNLKIGYNHSVQWQERNIDDNDEQTNIVAINC